jgi:hypothetical protein
MQINHYRFFIKNCTQLDDILFISKHVGQNVFNSCIAKQNNLNYTIDINNNSAIDISNVNSNCIIFVRKSFQYFHFRKH